MGLFDYIRKRFSSLFRIVTSGRRYDDGDIQRVLAERPQSLQEPYAGAVGALADSIRRTYAAANSSEFTIAVVGDYSVGKSSFVNAMLGARFLPVSVNPSTAVITKIKYGRKRKAVVKYADGTEKEMTYEEYLGFSAFNTDDFRERRATGRISRFENVREAELYVPSDFLKQNNLCIVDTLGLSADDADNRKTIESIRDAVVVVYICGERGLTQRDKEFIAGYLGHVILDSFVCINRIDLVRHDERAHLAEVVKLKLDDAIGRRGDEGFPASSIHQVSSLYQEFANGFTDHKDWHPDVDYGAESGFETVMGDLGRHIGEQADELRRKAVTKQLEDARAQVAAMRQARDADFGIQTASLQSRIASAADRKRDVDDRIRYIDALFEGLRQNIRGMLPDVYPDFVRQVDAGWKNTLDTQLMTQATFKVGDYLALETSVTGVKMNVFVSDKDRLYAGIDSLKQFVNPVVSSLVWVLGEVMSRLSHRVKDAVGEFATRNSMTQHFPDPDIRLSCQVFESPGDAIRNAMFREAALAGVESTWIKNDTRKARMFEASKAVAMRMIEQPLTVAVREAYDGRVLPYLAESERMATAELRQQATAIESEIAQLEKEVEALGRQHDIENRYFDRLTTALTATP